MHPRTAIKDTVLSNISQNVQDDGLIETVEEISLSSTNAAIMNNQPLPNFDEYREWF